MLHLATNKTSEMAFGVPAFRRLLRWFTAYNEVIESYADRMKAAAKLYMRRAIKAKISLLKQQTDFLLATGLIPRDLSAIDYERDAVELADTLLDVLEAHDVPWEVQNAVVQAVDARSGSRALTSGSRTEVGLPLEGEARDVRT